jgi:hypothetical protein
MIFAGCSSTEKNEKIVTQSVVASDFVLEVTTPTSIVTVTKKGKQNLLVNIAGDISLTMNPIEILVK